jgi:hypothetical protein
VRHLLNGSFNICATVSKAISKFALAYPAVFRFCAGSLDVLAMLLHHSPILMAHTRSQELVSRFKTLQSGFLGTQQEVQQLSATISSRDASINASINVVM